MLLIIHGEQQTLDPVLAHNIFFSPLFTPTPPFYLPSTCHLNILAESGVFKLTYGLVDGIVLGHQSAAGLGFDDNVPEQ